MTGIRPFPHTRPVDGQHDQLTAKHAIVTFAIIMLGTEIIGVEISFRQTFSVKTADDAGLAA